MTKKNQFHQKKVLKLSMKGDLFLLKNP